MSWVTAISAALLLGVQDGPSQAAQDAMRSAFEAVNQSKLMLGIAKLEHAYETGSEADKSILGQLIGTYYSFAGDYRKANELFASEGKPPEEAPLPESSPLDATKPEDALKAIVREARDKQIVILNEAHHRPENRLFGAALARELRKLGFEFFAAETFNPSMAEAVKLGYPTVKMGMYTNEPTFGDMVRQAMGLGYKLVEYEGREFKQGQDHIDRINDRETQQANNLIANVLKDRPKARIFVFCGYSHATENWRNLPDGREMAWMAARLKKLTGIDPLTIDQTQQMEHLSSAAETLDYRYATSKRWLRGPTVFRQPDGAFAVLGRGWEGAVDVQVFHPRTKPSSGRPDWMQFGGRRKPTKVPYQAQKRVLIQAFVAAEGEDAVPMDQIILAPQAKDPVLMLPRGEYRIVVQDEEGRSTPVTRIRQRG